MSKKIITISREFGELPEKVQRICRLYNVTETDAVRRSLWIVKNRYA